MKSLILSFLLIVFLGSSNVDIVFSNPLTNSNRFQTADWSGLFPEIAGCEREIKPLSQNGEVFEQIAVYKTAGLQNDRGCGSIVLRRAPEAKKAARESFKPYNMFSKKVQIGKFEAYRNWAQCGNDYWAGSVAVHFDDDKVLIVSANRTGLKILEFAESADYELLKKSINDLVEAGKAKTEYKET